MKDLKHIKRFNEHQENLNISDVSDSDFDEAGTPYTDNLDVTFLKPAKEANAS